MDRLVRDLTLGASQGDGSLHRIENFERRLHDEDPICSHCRIESRDSHSVAIYPRVVQTRNYEGATYCLDCLLLALDIPHVSRAHAGGA